MGTRSRIGIINDDGSVDSIYVHNDGYLEGVGLALANDYVDAVKIRALIDEGDHSAIAGKVQSYRSLGESIKETAPRRDPCTREFYEGAEKDDCYFAYLFDSYNSEWLVGTKESGWKSRPLAAVLPPR